jgi:K+-transporting ATPase c subunit
MFCEVIRNCPGSFQNAKNIVQYYKNPFARQFFYHDRKSKTKKYNFPKSSSSKMNKISCHFLQKTNPQKVNFRGAYIYQYFNYLGSYGYSNFIKVSYSS